MRLPPTLIIIRGNSGSGKSTLARELRLRLAREGLKAALVEQDYLRRIVLKEKETDGGDNIDLIEQTVRFSLARGYCVVLEGILVFSRYGAMLRRLVQAAERTRAYYMDVPFEETLRRHVTKPNAHEFGEEEMRRWWQEHDVTGFPGEKVILAESGVEESVAAIIQDMESSLSD
jgi:predicted kinase